MRDDAARVEDIVEACDQLARHVAPDEERFFIDPMVQAAAQRWLEIIGEAGQVSQLIGLARLRVALHQGC